MKKVFCQRHAINARGNFNLWSSGHEMIFFSLFLTCVVEEKMGIEITFFIDGVVVSGKEIGLGQF